MLCFAQMTTNIRAIWLYTTVPRINWTKHSPAGENQRTFAHKYLHVFIIDLILLKHTNHIVSIIIIKNHIFTYTSFNVNRRLTLLCQSPQWHILAFSNRSALRTRTQFVNSIPVTYVRFSRSAPSTYTHGRFPPNDVKWRATWRHRLRRDHTSVTFCF